MMIFLVLLQNFKYSFMLSVGIDDEISNIGSGGREQFSDILKIKLDIYLVMDNIKG